MNKDEKLFRAMVYEYKHKRIVHISFWFSLVQLIAFTHLKYVLGLPIFPWGRMTWLSILICFYSICGHWSELNWFECHFEAIKSNWQITSWRAICHRPWEFRWKWRLCNVNLLCIMTLSIPRKYTDNISNAVVFVCLFIFFFLYSAVDERWKTYSIWTIRFRMIII